MAEPKKSSEETVTISIPERTDPQRVREVFWFPSNITIGRDFEATELDPARTIKFHKSEISAIGSWWSTEITENLANLCLYDCKIPLANLLAMLQRTPNLCSLELGRVPTLVYNVAVEKFSDLRLQKMETLILFELEQYKVMEVFIRTFPRLKVFEMITAKAKSCDRFLKAMDASEGLHTLEELVLVLPTPNRLFRLAQVKHQFQRVTLTMSYNATKYQRFYEPLIKFSKNQPLLNSLDLGFESYYDETPLQTSSIEQHGDTTKCLTEVLGNLLHLKRLSIVRVPDVADLPGLECLTELEYFYFHGYTKHQPFSFSGIKHPNLEELRLDSITLVPGELQEYTRHAPKLRKIVLQHCVLDSWAELFDAVHPEEFRHLELHCVKVSTDASLFGYFNGLRCLKLAGCGMTKDFLLTLLGRCPRLEKLTFGRIECDCDDVVLLACQKITELRELTLHHCPITDVALENIAEHGPNLERIMITDYKKLTNEAITQFRSTCKADIHICPCHSQCLKLSKDCKNCIN